MALPPHLMNLQQKLNSMNLPKMPINNQQNIPENKSDNIISKNSLTQTSLKREKKQKLPKHMTKKWKTFRKAAGTIWEDPTLDEWPDNDYRIFCGDLGNEVSDQILATEIPKSFIKCIANLYGWDITKQDDMDKLRSKLM